jgi:hypothetical protein
MDIEYKTYNVSIKTYRHRHYSRYSQHNPEYHPKLELSAYKENAELTTISIETIKTIAILLNTIVHTLRLTLIYGEYEKQQEHIVVYGVDTEFKRIITGVKKRVKAIQILDKEYHDIRLAVAELLVNKKLRPAEIAKMLGVSRVYIHKKINELIENNVIKRVGKGKYTWAKRKTELPKQEVIRHTHVKTLQELIDKIHEIKHSTSYSI